MTADPLGLLSPSFTPNLRLTESLLRSLRALLMALADEVSPGTRWERGLGLTSRLDSAASSQFKGRPLAALGKSHREIVGWYIADAGFESDGDTKMTAAASSSSSSPTTANTRRSKRDTMKSKLSPREELTLLAREAINYAFSEETLPLWLGTIFIAQLPTMMKTNHSAKSSQHTSLANSRASTRPASPALNSVSTTTTGSSSLASGVSRSSSRMSYTSQFTEDRSSPNTSETPIMSNQIRLLGITEMVLGILSCCLDIAERGQGPPAENTGKKRQSVLDFVASDSPFWIPVNDVDRGRPEENSLVEEQQPMQASFVKRGKSTDDRRGDIRENSQAIDADDGSIRADKSVLDVILEATECGYTKVSLFHFEQKSEIKLTLCRLTDTRGCFVGTN